jgi:hypothetical protein
VVSGPRLDHAFLTAGLMHERTIPKVRLPKRLASVLLTAAPGGSAGCSGVGVRISDEPHRSDPSCDDRDLPGRASLPERHRENWKFRTLDSMNKKLTGSGAMLILIAIETASRPADRRYDAAYSTEPHDLMTWWLTTIESGVGEDPPKRAFFQMKYGSCRRLSINALRRQYRVFTERLSEVPAMGRCRPRR